MREPGQNFPPTIPPAEAAPAAPRPALRADGSVDPPRPSFAEFRAAAEFCEAAARAADRAARPSSTAPTTSPVAVEAWRSVARLSSTAPKTSPVSVMRDTDRQAILLTLMEANGAVPLGDMSKESRFARMQNVLMAQAFIKLNNERPCDFPEGDNLETVERELHKIKGSIAVDRVNEANLLIRDKSDPMLSVIFQLFDERTQTWKSNRNPRDQRVVNLILSFHFRAGNRRRFSVSKPKLGIETHRLAILNPT